MLSYKSGRQRETLREQIAQKRELADLKFRRLLAELREFEAIQVQTQAPAPQQTQRVLSPHAQVAPSPTALPVLQLPLGSIAIAPHSSSLPPIGFNLGQTPVKTQIAQLQEYLLEHNREPFARPLFLGSDLALLPLLGRYGFAFHRYHESFQPEIPYLAVRYGLHQIRALDTGLVEWSKF